VQHLSTRIAIYCKSPSAKQRYGYVLLYEKFLACSVI